MELATFGAILSFALEMEKHATVFYSDAARGELEELFLRLADGSKKREIRIERARREGIAEMILEPISGLDSDDFEVNPDPNAGSGDILNHAVALERNAARFYDEAAKKLPVREVARILIRMAKDSEKRIVELEKI
jgi:rubrerythrin